MNRRCASLLLSPRTHAWLLTLSQNSLLENRMSTILDVKRIRRCFGIEPGGFGGVGHYRAASSFSVAVSICDSCIRLRCGVVYSDCSKALSQTVISGGGGIFVAENTFKMVGASPTYLSKLISANPTRPM